MFYFCHLKKLVRPETFGPYYVLQTRKVVMQSMYIMLPSGLTATTNSTSFCAFISSKVFFEDTNLKAEEKCVANRRLWNIRQVMVDLRDSRLLHNCTDFLSSYLRGILLRILLLLLLLLLRSPSPLPSTY